MDEKIYLLVHDRPFENGEVLAIYRSKDDAIADANHAVFNDPLLEGYECEHREDQMTWDFRYKGQPVERMMVVERELLNRRRHS